MCQSVRPSRAEADSLPRPPARSCLHATAGISLPRLTDAQRAEGMAPGARVLGGMRAPECRSGLLRTKKQKLGHFRTGLGRFGLLLICFTGLVPPTREPKAEGTEGHRFESCRARYKSPAPAGFFIFPMWDRSHRRSRKGSRKPSTSAALLGGLGSRQRPQRFRCGQLAASGLVGERGPQHAA